MEAISHTEVCWLSRGLVLKLNNFEISKNKKHNACLCFYASKGERYQGAEEQNEIKKKEWWKELSMVATPLKSRILKLDKTNTKQKGKKTKKKNRTSVPCKSRHCRVGGKKQQ